MKAKTNDHAKGKVREVKVLANEKVRKLTLDPTLEGRNENTVGRIERKLNPREKALER